MDTPAYKILILEDSEIDAELMTRELQKYGLNFDSKCLENGPEFEESVLNWEPDLVISDHNLSGTYSGRDALRFCKQHFPNMPFIAVSGVITKDTEIELLQNRANDVVPKGHMERLPYAVKRAIQERDDAEELRKKTISLEKLVQEKEELVKEIHHRVKNNLALFSAFLELDKMQESNAKVRSSLEANILRVKSIGVIHELVYEFDDYAKIPISTSIKKIFGLYISSDQITIQTEALTRAREDATKITTLIPLGLFVNEWLNKYNRKHSFKPLYVDLVFELVSDAIILSICSKELTNFLDHLFEEDEDETLVLKTLIQQIEGELKLDLDSDCTIIEFKN
jgi:CheY-like chemotaxis protein